VPWSKLLSSRTVWLLWVQYFCFSYGWYFYITWLPTYLKEARGMELQKGALLAVSHSFSVELDRCFGLAGRLADTRRFDVTRTRRRLSYVGIWAQPGCCFFPLTSMIRYWE